MSKQDNPQLIQAWQEAVRQEVAQRPWLASLVWQKKRYLFERFTLFYNRLRAAPRQLRRKLAYGVAGAALMLALSGAPTPAHAATITVGPDCTLVQAIVSANTDAVAPGSSCVAGSGPDTIALAGGTYSYTTNYGVSLNALPEITSTITIEGNGATIQRTGGSSFRLFRVSTLGLGGDLTLNNATVSGGNTASSGSAIFNSNITTLNNTTISGNTGSTGGGLRNSSSGVMTINNSTLSGNNGVNGGAINNSGTLTINNSTITGNDGSTNGGGILTTGGTVTLNRTIISGNSSSSGAEVELTAGTITAANFNLFGHNGLTNAQAFIGFTPAGPSDRTATNGGTIPTALNSILNTTLADNGGPTRTHALVAGSPAIDIIPTTDPACDPGVSVDQRGAVRAGQVTLGDNRGGLSCDAGAFEFASNQTPTAVTMQSITTISTPNQIPLIPILATLLALLSSATLWLRRKTA